MSALSLHYDHGVLRCESAMCQTGGLWKEGMLWVHILTLQQALLADRLGTPDGQPYYIASYEYII